MAWSMTMNRACHALACVVVFALSGLLISCTNQTAVDYAKLKQQIQELEPQVTELKQAQLVKEGARGYLIGVETITLEQRKIVQQENYLREQLFEILARWFKTNRNQVAATFASKACAASASVSQ